MDKISNICRAPALIAITTTILIICTYCNSYMQSLLLTAMRPFYKYCNTYYFYITGTTCCPMHECDASQSIRHFM